MPTEAENLRRVQNLEASVQQLGTQVLNLSALIKEMQTTVGTLITTVNGMTKP